MSQPSLIRLENVTKVYRMGDVVVHALRGLSLSIEQGEFTAVMGASGSGKSTLMNIIGLLDRPTGGAYLLEGEEVSKLTTERLAEVRNQTIGFVFQSFNLLARTSALENVELPLLYGGVHRADRHRRAGQSLDRVGLADRADHHPNQMSGGQQPRVILADEPTGNLDSRTSVEVMALFQELGRSGITVVLVTHEADISQYASRVIIMRDGRILSDERQTPRTAVVPPAAPDDEEDPP
jgi:putative ABC transport system ATP-binding protein